MIDFQGKTPKILVVIVDAEPTVEVRPLPVAVTGAKVFQAPEFQVCRPHPWIVAIIYSPMRSLKLQQLLQQQGT